MTTLNSSAQRCKTIWKREQRGTWKGNESSLKLRTSRGGQGHKDRELFGLHLDRTVDSFSLADQVREEERESDVMPQCRREIIILVKC